MNNDLMFSSKKDDWGTPQDLFDRLDKLYGFTLDAAANHENAKCNSYYTQSGFFQKQNGAEGGKWIHANINGLTGQWNLGGKLTFGGGWTWCNPPYGREVGKWVAKAWHEMKTGNSSVLLLPARTDTRYFHGYIWDALSRGPRHGVSVDFLKGRLKFEGAVNQKTGKADPAPFPSMLVEFSSYDYKR